MAVNFWDLLWNNGNGNWNDHAQATITLGFFGSESLQPVSNVPAKNVDALQKVLWGGAPQTTTVFDHSQGVPHEQETEAGD